MAEAGTDAGTGTPGGVASPAARAADQADHRAAHRAANRTRAAERRRLRGLRARKRGGGLGLVLFLIFLALAATTVILGLTGRPVRLPDFVVAEAEVRLNRALAEAIGANPQTAIRAVSVGGAVLVVDRDDWTPRLRIEDVRLLDAGGQSLVVVPDLRLAFDPDTVLGGGFRPRSVRMSGAQVNLTRRPDGTFDLALGGAFPELRAENLPLFLDAIDRAFARPLLSSLRLVEAQGLSLTVDDRRAGRVWQMGDGRMRMELRPAGLAVEMGLSLDGAAAAPASASLTVVTDRARAQARVAVAVDGIAAQDIAAQEPTLGWLRLIEGTALARFEGTVTPQGLRGVSGRLEMGPGALRPSAGAVPQPFRRLTLAFDHDPARDRIDLREVVVDSASLRLQATGHAYLPGLSRGGVPQTALVQMQIGRLELDPAGLFEAPAQLTGGALDLRLTLEPFSVEIGQAVVLDGAQRMIATGRFAAEPAGWRVAVDLSLDAIGRDRLLALWPVNAVARTRTWLQQNVQAGDLFDVQAALRLDPGAPARLSLGYEFADAEVRVLRSLPPVARAFGHAVIDGNRYTVVIDRGEVTAPQGGAVDVAGSVLVVPDITAKPANAEVSIAADGPMTAMLSLLDQPPFEYITRAGQRVDLGQGRARIRGTVRMPLVSPAPPGSVVWQAQGVVQGFRSDLLVPGRVIEVPALAVSGDLRGMTLGGAGTLDGVPFDGALRQDFVPRGQTPPPGRVTGRVEISPATVERLRLGLPDGMVLGSGSGDVAITLSRGEAPALRLTSDLAGVRLAVPELGWSKGAGGDGRLEVAATLGAAPRVDSLSLDAAGLRTEAQIDLAPGGGLAEARFSRLQLGGWMDVQATLTGRGPGATPAVAVTGGSIDLRRVPDRGAPAGGGAGAEIPFRLDRVTVSEGIALTGVAGQLATRGGLSGDFTARVNGEAAVAGRLAPAPGGTAVRLTSQDAGAVLSAAGIFPDARGGTLELLLSPQPGGGYRGQADVAAFRVRNTPIMAELLNAISVVGLFEQLDGGGLLFQEADAVFSITERGVQVDRAAATGASLGVSMAGFYDQVTRQLNMTGTISPVYLLNAIGGVVSARRGEGLIGINYSLTGTAADPQVSVNPLSILTPGVFRELFRGTPPVLPGQAPVVPAPDAAQRREEAQEKRDLR